MNSTYYSHQIWFQQTQIQSTHCRGPSWAINYDFNSHFLKTSTATNNDFNSPDKDFNSH